MAAKLHRLISPDSSWSMDLYFAIDVSGAVIGVIVTVSVAVAVLSVLLGRGR